MFFPIRSDRRKTRGGQKNVRGPGGEFGRLASPFHGSGKKTKVSSTCLFFFFASHEMAREKNLAFPSDSRVFLRAISCSCPPRKSHAIFGGDRVGKKPLGGPDLRSGPPKKSEERPSPQIRVFLGAPIGDRGPEEFFYRSPIG